MSRDDDADAPVDLSRRGFLTGFLGGNKRTEAAPPRRRFSPVHRPPHALAEVSFLEACTACGDCATACPHDAITKAPARLRAGVDTPVISADVAPCRMCVDVPCVAACATGALTPAAPARMATVRIQEWACLAHQGSFCTVCHEQCPVPGATVVVDGRPQIVADSCTGCGVCRFVCPAPENAILLMPGGDPLET